MLGRISTLSAISLALALVCTAIGVPAAWIFAFLIVFGADAVFSGRATIPPAFLMTPAQVLIAMLCAGPLATVSGGQVASYLAPAALSLVVTLVVCAFGAWLLHRVNRVDGATGLLATLAGGASGMVLIARDVRADVQFVTLTQYLRLTVIVFTLPGMVAWLSAYSDAPGADSVGTAGVGESSGAVDPGLWGGVVAAAGSFWRTPWQGVLGALAVGLLVWLIVKATGPLFKIPSPYLIVSMAVVVAAIAAGVPQEFVLPEGLAVNLAYAIIGIQAGGTLTKGALRQFSAALPMLLGVLLLMVASSLATGWFIAWTSDFDILDAYLATVPGGVYAVLAFAHDSGSDPLVTVVQVLRVLVMLIAGAFAPTVIDWLRRTGPTRQTGSPSRDAADHPTVR